MAQHYAAVSSRRKPAQKLNDTPDLSKSMSLFGAVERTVHKSSIFVDLPAAPGDFPTVLATDPRTTSLVDAAPRMDDFN